jgi:broad specificity phosphatase PhoE
VRVLMVRHGQQERTGGDGPLTRLGRRQAAVAGSAINLAEDDRLIASTLRRAVGTASAFGRAPEKVADLDEFRFGPGWTWEQGDEREDLALWRPEDRAPGGESLRDFHGRVQSVLQALVMEPPAGRLVLVVHSGVIDAVLRWVFGLGPDVPWTTEALVAHASITEFRHWPNGRHASGAPSHTLLARLGDVSHLPSDLVTGL